MTKTGKKKQRLMATINWLGEFRVLLEEKDGVAKFVTYRRGWVDNRMQVRKIGEGKTLTDQLALVMDEINNGR